MDQSITSLAFKGSITEAINEAKTQKKLFVVYISGDDAESIRLEKSTFVDHHVAESLSKYCILLHILAGSTDAAYFSAIYPQKSVPSITAIGYNGVLVWQNEGFVDAETLASTLEKAWLSLHIQETTASVLTAALASKSSKPHDSEVSDTVSFEQGSSSNSDVSSPSTSKHDQSLETRLSAESQMINERKGCEDAAEESDILMTGETSAVSVDKLKIGEAEVPLSSAETANDSISRSKVDLINIGVSIKNKDGSLDTDKNVVDHHLEATPQASRSITDEASETVQGKRTAVVEEKKVNSLDSSMSNRTDVYLNIRLPSGTNLQEKFSLTCTLKMVKDYVYENQESGTGSYDLALPYPRKVFNNQDLSKTLSELGLFNRQALIVVPHQRASGHRREGSSMPNLASSSNADSSNGGEGGYFSFLKRMLSYVNPLSYLGGGASSSNSVQEPQSSMWQYSPNPTLQNDLRSAGRPYSVYSSGQRDPSTDKNSSKSRKPTTSGFGSNIHTLKHDEDDSRFSDRNAFWNGNSTQYGGDNDGK